MSSKTTSRLGFQQITGLNTVKTLTLPTSADAISTPAAKQGQRPTIAVIQAEAQAVRWRDDGVAPTAAIGMTIPAGGELRYDGDLQALQFIEVTASAKLNVTYFA